VLIRRAALAAALLAATAAPAGAQVQAPKTDPFYQSPTPLAGVAVGTVLRSRPIDINAAGIPIGLFDGWQVLYATRDTHDKPEATVATIIVPKSAPPAGGRPLVAYTPAEDALTQDCAPSYEIRKGTHAELLAQLLALLRGAAVVVPDYEGPESQWIAGVQAGHATLDAVRAAESFAPAKLNGAKTPVGIWGYSGGGHAAGWTAELQPSYAPELNVKGIAFGGAPAFVAQTIRNVDGGPFAGILFGAIVGLSRAYPELDPDVLFNAKGKAMAADVGKGCLTDWLASYALHKFSEYTIDPDPFNLPVAKKIMAAVNLGQRRPSAPVHLYHSVLDELNPVAEADRLRAVYCEQGVPVDYNRSLAGEHIVVVATGAPAAAAFLADRFAGKPAPNGCPPSKPAAKPAQATPPLRLTKLRRSTRGRRTTVRFTLSEPATVRMHIARITKRARSSAGTRQLRARAGANVVRFSLRPGRYDLTVTATPASGATAGPRSLRFTVPSRQSA
jgi:hypothetical protein